MKAKLQDQLEKKKQMRQLKIANLQLNRTKLEKLQEEMKGKLEASAQEHRMKRAVLRKKVEEARQEGKTKRQENAAKEKTKRHVLEKKAEEDDILAAKVAADN